MSAYDYQTLKAEIRDKSLIITMNRPDVRNALNETMVAELADIFNNETVSSEYHAVILTGSGSAFCAGADLTYLKSLQGLSFAEQKKDSIKLLAMYTNVFNFPKPVIALVNGPAIGGGCGLAGVCDFAIASESAKFGYPEVKIGFTPAIVSVFLIYSLGQRKAKELLLTGKILNAQQALNFGLINDITEPDTLLKSGMEIAQSLGENSASSMRLTKQFLNHIQDIQGMRELLEESADFNAKSRFESDFIEGISAFIEKRTPNWRNS